MSVYKRLRIRNIIYEHVKNNIKDYFLISLIFLIGVFLGVMCINNLKDVQVEQITSYLNGFVENLKNIENLEYGRLLKTSLCNNMLVGLAVCFFGTTVIGIPIVFGIILYRGFCLGYTIASCIIVMSLKKGIFFILNVLLLQNIIFIPAIIAIGVSGLKLYRAIIKERSKDGIKSEVMRHIIFSVIMFILLCIASFVEIIFSTNLLKKFIKYF